MRSDLHAPLSVLGTFCFTALLMAGLLYYGTEPFRHIRTGRHVGWMWKAAEGDPVSGRDLFAANCASCHREDGQGMTGLAPSIRNRDFLAIASDGFIRSTIRRGRSGTAMIPRPDLDDMKVSDIIAYLHTLPVPNPVEIDIDPELVLAGNPGEGRHLYSTFCSSCHGANGEGYAAGGSGPGIGLPGFLNVVVDDYILQTVKHGRLGTAMRPFVGSRGLANLTEDDVGDIIAFLRENSGRAMVVGAASGGLPDPGTGLRLFANNCVPCHQEGGVGKVGLAPSIRNRDFLALASDDFIKQTVTKGRPGTGMVPRPDLAGQLDHIVAYLRSLPVSNPVNITLDEHWKAAGDIASGQAKYNRFCSPCHGANGEGYSAGGSGPGIGLEGFLAQASDDFILQTVKQGRIGTAMMPFVGSRGLANLEESDVSDIIVYLRNRNN